MPSLNQLLNSAFVKKQFNHYDGSQGYITGIFCFKCIMHLAEFLLRKVWEKGPDDKIQILIYLKSGKSTYSVLYKNQVLLEKYRLGLRTNITDYSEVLTFAGS